MYFHSESTCQLVLSGAGRKVTAFRPNMIKQKTHLEHENKKLYYRCELPLSIHIYSTVTNPRNSHNNLQHTFKSKLFKAYAVKDLLNYPFSTRKLKNNNFTIISHLASSFKFHRKIPCKFQTKYLNITSKQI